MSKELPSVLLLTDSDVFAGTERHILALGSGLRDAGVTVRIACPALSPLAMKSISVALELIPLPKLRLMDFEAIPLLRRLLRSVKPDIVHAHNGRTALLAAMSRHLAPTSKVVVTQHFLDPSRVARSGVGALLSGYAHGWVGRRIDRHIAISHAVKRRMLHRRESGAESVAVIHNGIDPALNDNSDAGNDIRAELHLDSSKSQLVLCVARLEQEKDISTLVSAMKAVRCALPTATCVIAGQGSQETAIRAQIIRLGLQKVVHLLGFREDTSALIDTADLFVLPSVAEPFGLVILEAMARGRAVIATKAGGPPEIVEDGETGYLVEPGNSRTMADAICQLLRDPAERSRMGSNGRDRFMQFFTAKRMAEETLAVYQRILAEKRSEARATSSPNERLERESAPFASCDL